MASPSGMYSINRTVSRLTNESRAKSTSSSSLVPRIVTQLIFRPKARVLGRIQPAQHRGKITRSGDSMEPFGRSESMLTVTRSRPAWAERMGQVRQSLAVGGQREVFDSVDAAKHRDQIEQARANGWLAACQFESADAMDLHRGAHHIANFFEAEDVRPRQPADAFLGHAVDAAIIASVGDADPQYAHCRDRPGAGFKAGRLGRQEIASTGRRTGGLYTPMEGIGELDLTVSAVARDRHGPSFCKAAMWSMVRNSPAIHNWKA